MNKAIYVLLIAAIIAGVNGLLIKQMSSLNAGSIAWFRATVPLVFLLPVLLDKKDPVFRGNYKKMLLASSVNALRLFFYLIAFIFTSIGNAVVLFYSWPIFVTLISAFYLKERIPKKQVLLLALAFIGLVITYADKSFSFGNDDFVGMLAAVLSALGYAITVIIFKSESQNYNKEQIIIYQNIVGALVFIPFLGALPEAQLEHIGIALGYGFLIGIVVFKMFFYGLHYLSASTTSSLMYLEVVSAVLLGYFILHEVLTPNTLIGGALIVTSSFLISRGTIRA